MGYLYVDNEGKIIGEQISVFDLLDEEDKDTDYDKEDDE